MATYYLDWNSGSANNANAGTSESLPWKDLLAITSRTFNPADNIYFKAGTYLISGSSPVINDSNGVGTSGNPILFAAYPGHENQVTITRASTPSALATRDGVNFAADYWHIRAINFRRMVWTNGNQAGMEFSYNDFNGTDYPTMQNDSVSKGVLRAGLLCEYDGLIGAHIHHNIFQNWRSHADATVFNTTGLIAYSFPSNSQNYLIEDNWFRGAPQAFYEKEGALNNIWQRNLVDGAIRGNNQGRDAIYDFRHNVVRGGWFEMLHLTDGAKYYNNYFTTGKMFSGTSVDTIDDLEIYNNVVVPSHSSHEVWQTAFLPYKVGRFAYYDDNIYGTATPKYRFSGISQPLSYMTTRGHELSSETGVALSSIYDTGWALKTPYKTAGRNNGPVGPVDASGNSIVALILDTSRYGPAAFNPGAPPTNSPPNASFSFVVDGLDVDVDASGSSDIDGTIADPGGYSWNWGDGTANGSGKITGHTYATSGEKTITLTVTDDDSATDQQALMMTVGSDPYVQFARSRVSPGKRSYVLR